MTKIKIDKESLVMALEDHGGEVNWYLDLETGEIIPLSEYDILDEEKELYKEISEGSDRYLCIEPFPSHEGYKIMENFISSLSDSRAQEALSEAILRKKPFYNFKKFLYYYPEIEKKWFTYHKEEFCEEAPDWLGLREDDYEFVDRFIPPTRIILTYNRRKP